MTPADVFIIGLALLLDMFALRNRRIVRMDYPTRWRERQPGA